MIACRLALLFAAAAVALAFAATGGSGAAEGVTQRIGPADNGKAKTVRVGQSFELRLPENPSTGYRWRLRPIGPVLALEGDSYVAAVSERRGAPGQHRWQFRAVEAGAVRLTLDSQRSFEPKPVATFAVAIDAAAR